MRSIKTLILFICLPIVGVGQCVYGDCENGTNAIAKYSIQNGGTVKYEGGFNNGKFNGIGKYYQDGILIYEGGFNNGKFNGIGKYYQDGILIYEGGFADHKFYGIGKSYQDEILIYDGGWKDDRMDGKGKYYQDGILIYDGAWKDNRRDGKGKYYQDEILLYDGDWQGDRMTGSCKMYRNGKIYYNGEVIDGVENGIGTFYHETGKEYTVIWKDGQTAINTYDLSDINGSKSEKCEIALINDFGNSYKIDITVDGIKKQYVYDTGATYFSINTNMEQELILQGKIKDEDYYPPQRFKIANGEILEKRIVRLDNIKIGDYIVNNVFTVINDNNDDGILLCGLGLLKKKFSQEGRMGNTLILYR